MDGSTASSPPPPARMIAKPTQRQPIRPAVPTCFWASSHSARCLSGAGAVLPTGGVSSISED